MGEFKDRVIASMEPTADDERRMPHPWSSDPVAQSAVRAAEDAAAVPSIQHRDLPEIVAELRERVARLEAAQATLGSGDVYADVGCGSTGDEIARLTAERDAAIRERDAAREECERLRGRLATLEPIAKAHESAIKAAEKFNAEQAARAMADPESAYEFADAMANGMHAGTAACLRPIMRAIIEQRDTYKARVAELEAAAAPAANAGVEDNSEPVAWGVLMTPGSKVWRCSSEKQAQKCVDHFGTGTVVPLYAAPQPPRGWLTKEERDAVDAAADAIGDRIDAYKEQDGDRRRIEVLDGLLARETPPKVKVPHLDDLEADERPVWESACSEWIAAIREAGGEVE